MMRRCYGKLCKIMCMHRKMQLHELQLTLNGVSSASEYHFEYTAEYMREIVDCTLPGKVENVMQCSV